MRPGFVVTVLGSLAHRPAFSNCTVVAHRPVASGAFDKSFQVLYSPPKVLEECSLSPTPPWCLSAGSQTSLVLGQLCREGDG